jgi:hypothetical protein
VEPFQLLTAVGWELSHERPDARQLGRELVELLLLGPRLPSLRQDRLAALGERLAHVRQTQLLLHSQVSRHHPVAGVLVRHQHLDAILLYVGCQPRTKGRAIAGSEHHEIERQAGLAIGDEAHHGLLPPDPVDRLIRP